MFLKSFLNIVLIALGLAIVGCGKPAPTAAPNNAASPRPEASNTPLSQNGSEVIAGQWKLIGFGAPW